MSDLFSNLWKAEILKTKLYCLIFPLAHNLISAFIYCYQ